MSRHARAGPWSGEVFCSGVASGPPKLRDTGPLEGGSLKSVTPFPNCCGSAPSCDRAPQHHSRRFRSFGTSDDGPVCTDGFPRSRSRARSLCGLSAGRDRSLGCRRSVGEIVKGRNAVRPGPDADGARPGDVIVVQLDVSLPSNTIRILVPANSARSVCHTLPATGASTYLIVLRRPSLGVIERDIVLQGVRPGAVVVVPVLPSPDNAAGLILPSGNRLELHLDGARRQASYLSERTRGRCRYQIA